MTRFERWAVWTTSAATTVTGLAYLWLKYGLEPAGPWAVVSHPLQPWALKAHILVAPFLVFAVGMIVTRHIWRHIRTGVREGHRSGLAAFLSLAPMVVTGYLIQTVTHETWLRWLVVAHVVSSLVFVVGLVAHILVSRSAGRVSGASGTGRDTGPSAESEAGDPMAVPRRRGARHRPDIAARGASTFSKNNG